MTGRQVIWIEIRKDRRTGYLERKRKGPEKMLPEVKTRKDRRTVYLEPKQQRTECYREPKQERTGNLE